MTAKKEDPTTVLISEEQHPVPVAIEPSSLENFGRKETVIKGEGTTLSPTTTEEEDITTEGQRIINRLWGRTQSSIALMVVVSGVTINSVVILMIIFLNKEVSVTQLSLIPISLQFINLTTGIVIGFYFSRTNHTAKGGIGPQKQYPYTGR